VLIDNGWSSAFAYLAADGSVWSQDVFKAWADKFFDGFKSVDLSSGLECSYFSKNGLRSDIAALSGALDSDATLGLAVTSMGATAAAKAEKLTIDNAVFSKTWVLGKHYGFLFDSIFDLDVGWGKVHERDGVFNMKYDAVRDLWQGSGKAAFSGKHLHSIEGR